MTPFVFSLAKRRLQPLQKQSLESFIACGMFMQLDGTTFMFVQQEQDERHQGCVGHIMVDEQRRWIKFRGTVGQGGSAALLLYRITACFGLSS